jgi:hypothetical protein
VDVDVHLLAGKVDEQGDDRVPVAGEQVLIGGPDAPISSRSFTGPSR